MINTPTFSLFMAMAAGVALIVSYSYYFFTVSSGTSGNVQIDDYMRQYTIAPLATCLILFFIFYMMWFMTRPSLNSQFATFFISYLSISISMFALLFSLYQVSVVRK